MVLYLTGGCPTLNMVSSDERFHVLFQVALYGSDSERRVWRVVRQYVRRIVGARHCSIRPVTSHTAVPQLVSRKADPLESGYGAKPIDGSAQIGYKSRSVYALSCRSRIQQKEIRPNLTAFLSFWAAYAGDWRPCPKRSC